MFKRKKQLSYNNNVAEGHVRVQIIEPMRCTTAAPKVL